MGEGEGSIALYIMSVASSSEWEFDHVSSHGSIDVSLARASVQYFIENSTGSENNSGVLILTGY